MLAPNLTLEDEDTLTHFFPKGWVRWAYQRKGRTPATREVCRASAAGRAPAPAAAKLQKISYFCPSISIKLLWGLSFRHRQLPVATGHTLPAPGELGPKQQQRRGSQVTGPELGRPDQGLTGDGQGRGRGIGNENGPGGGGGVPCQGQTRQQTRPLVPTDGKLRGFWWHSNALAKLSSLPSPPGGTSLCWHLNRSAKAK